MPPTSPAISGDRALARPASEAGSDEAVRRGERSTWARLGLCFVHLLVLSSLGLAQPLFDLLAKNAEFFAVRGSAPRDIVVFAVAVAFLPAAVLLAVETLAALVSRRLHWGVHLVFIAALSSVLAIQGVKRAGSLSTTVSLAAAALIGVGAAVVYARVRYARLVLTALAPAPLLFVGLFLLASPVKDLVMPAKPKLSLGDVSSRTPIVMVVFDELPVTSLMDAKGRIDAVRYRHFAALARDSTWFRNTTAVSGGTVRAVPAILTGRYPKLPDESRKRELPIFAHHPRNVFTLFGGRYRIHASEQMTRLCPQELCERRGGSFSQRTRSLSRDAGIVYLHVLLPDGLRDRLPSISDSWMNFGREEEIVAQAAPAPAQRRRATPVWGRAASFERFAASIRPSRRPTFHYVHILLPHQPWHYFRSGRAYLAKRDLLRSAGRGGHWPKDRGAVLQAFQRHLLQVQFVDRLLGRLLAHLRRVRMYDRSLLVVTADHGMSFRPGDRRRAETRTNAEDIAFVPLFVKLPGLRRGEVVDGHLQTLDILPTIADVMQTAIPWAVDGRSGFSGSSRERVRIGSMTFAAAQLERRRDEALDRQIGFFGSGKKLPGLFGLGPHPELVGRRIAALGPIGTAPADAAIEPRVAESLEDVPRGANVVPALLAGTVSGPGSAAGRGIAVAVNGRIAAVSRTFGESGTVRFSVLVPDSALRAGANRAELFWIEDGPGGATLESLGGFPS